MNFAQRLLQKLIKSDAVTQTVMALYPAEPQPQPNVDLFCTHIIHTRLFVINSQMLRTVNCQQGLD